MGEQRENATVWRFLEAKSSPQGVPEAIYDCDTERLCGRTGSIPDQSRRHGVARRGYSLLFTLSVGYAATSPKGRGFRSHSFRYSIFAIVSSRGRVYVAFPGGGRGTVCGG